MAKPPPIESVLPQVAGQLDVGYAEGLHLHGIRGTWHRLWALMVLDAQLGVESAEIRVILEQLAQVLGRELKPEEIAILRADAERAAKKLPRL